MVAIATPLSLQMVIFMCIFEGLIHWLLAIIVLVGLRKYLNDIFSDFCHSGE